MSAPSAAVAVQPYQYIAGILRAHCKWNKLNPARARPARAGYFRRGCPSFNAPGRSAARNNACRSGRREPAGFDFV